MEAVKNSMRRRLARSPWAADNYRQRVESRADQRRWLYYLVGQQDRLLRHQ
jgi:hypothetical protein